MPDVCFLVVGCFYLSLEFKAVTWFSGEILFAYFLLGKKNLSSVVPHITDTIQEWVMKQARVSVDDDEVEPEVCVIEVSRS